MVKINFFYPDHYCLNNLSAHEVEYQGKTYKTAEHAYHCQKFIDVNIVNKIMRATSPLEAKSIAHSHRAKTRTDWNSKKIKIMKEILRAKINQHLEVLKVLINSKNKKIIENSPDDYFWGIGKYKTGENHMGKLLMKLRKEFNQNQDKN